MQMSRLVLSQVDPVQTLQSRAAHIADQYVFNTVVKGVGDKKEYPNPRVNQQQSGRCWLFATS